MGVMKTMAYSDRGGRIGRDFSVDIRYAKDSFFDQQKVQRALIDVGDRQLPKSAARVRMIARRSMRYVSAKSQVVSAPGQPPRARRPKPWVRKFLFFYFDSATHSAVIGPARLPDSTDAPHDLEFGGYVHRANPRRRKRNVGGSGEIRVGGRRSRTTKRVRDWRGKTHQVTYARLHQASQAARANELNEQLYGPEVIQGTRAPRPFMGPALDRERPRIPDLFADSVRGD